MKKSVDIKSHAFLQKVINDNIPIQKAITKPGGSWLKSELIREMDEYEFYIATVGNRIAHLVNTVKQMEEIPKYITTLSRNWKNKKITWSTYSLLLYHIENFIIRTSTVYDKGLKLVDAVFHLQNDDRECRRNTILKNVHVSRSNIPKMMNDLEKCMEKYSKHRNSIVHHQNYDDRFLNLLEIYTVMLETELSEDRKTKLTDIARSILVDTAFDHKYGFRYCCEDIKKSLGRILDALDAHYERYKKRLLIVCGYSGIYHPINN